MRNFYIFLSDSTQAWPPCIRVIVTATAVPGLKVGTLFIVTCTGGTVGRQGDHAILIPDQNISKVSLFLYVLLFLYSFIINFVKMETRGVSRRMGHAERHLP